MTREANATVEAVLSEDQSGGDKRKRKYTHFTPQQRAKIAKYAAECGNTAAVRHFNQDFPSLGESTVRVFKKQYMAELKKKPGEDIMELVSKKRGRPLTLGELDTKAQQYIRSLRSAGTPVNARIVLAAAEGIVKATDRNMLADYGGHIQLTLSWAYSLLKRMGFVKRKATTKCKLTLTDEAFKKAKKSYLKKIKRSVKDGKIPPELVINMDQTGINVIPATQEERGSARVEVAGIGDKRQITVTLAGTLSVVACFHFKCCTKARHIDEDPFKDLD